MAIRESIPVRHESTAERATTCPECPGELLTADGETYCPACGLVVDEYRLDHGFERRSFDDGLNRERTGAPLTVARHDKGLSTEIGHGRDANGRSLSLRNRRRLGRLRKQHNRAKWRTKAERNLAHGLGEVTRVCSVLEAPRSVRDRAAVLFRSAQGDGLLAGRSIDGIAAACVYAACRELTVLRTAAEVGAAIGTDEGAMRRDYTVLNVELGLAALPFPPALFVSKFAADLAVPDRVRTRALELVRTAEANGRSMGSPPSTVAAAAVYLVARQAGLGLTQKQVAATGGTTDTTIRAQTRSLQAIV